MTTMQDIEALAAQLAEARDRLAAAIAAAPDLFEKKRSVVIHGIKTGFQRRHGSVEWDDDAALVAAIRRHVPERFAELVEVTERPMKEALAELDAATLESLGVRVKPAGERVIVRLIEDRAADEAQLALPFDNTATREAA